MKLFCIHDSKAAAYNPPITYRTPGEAIRAFEASCSDKNTQFNKFPADFTLCQIGEYDELTGNIIPSNPIIITNAAEIIRMQTTPN